MTDSSPTEIDTTKSEPSTNMAHQMKLEATFSIATPAVTQINKNLNDNLFMNQPNSYHYRHQSDATFDNQKTIDSTPVCSNDNGFVHGLDEQSESTKGDGNNDSIQKKSDETVPITETEETQGDTTKGPADISMSNPKKKNKISKKSLKLDTKSKLEKSRQSARECRARKKLRYQYLEDLVCNREKAVVKLREELTMFCEISKQLDLGTISEKDRNLLVEQTKENNKS